MLTHPSISKLILRICSSQGTPSYTIKIGLVVTPSIIPQAAAARSSSRLDESRKNFIKARYYQSMPVAEEIRIVPADESQIPLILDFIRKLAEYERLSSKVVADEALLRESLFGPSPKAATAIAYLGDEPAGF